MPLIALEMLILKVTLLYATGFAGLLITRKSTAATRHLVCLCALGGSLVLPFAALAPSTPITFHLAAINAAGSPGAVSSGSVWSWPELILALWISGFGFMLLRLAAGSWRVSKLRRSANPLHMPDVPPHVSVFDAAVSVPIVSGVLRPSIFMPHCWCAWPEWRTNAALRHELAHLERGDLKSMLIAQLACAVYWFHPLAWMLAAAMRFEQESACDDAVLHAGFEPADYAEALLATANNSSTNLLFGCPMTTKANVKTRLMRLLDHSIARTTSTQTLRKTGAAFAAVVVVIGMLSPVRADEVYKIGGDVTPPTVVLKIDPSYTPEAKAAKIQGTVVLTLVVDANGTARDVSVSAGIDPSLDANAVAAVQHWRFNPAIRKGAPVSAWATIEINFRLE